MKNSKNIIFRLPLVIILLCIFTKSDAQKLEAGLRIMPGISTFNVSSSSGSTIKGKATLGIGFGGIVGYSFGTHIAFQGEIIYSAISQKFKEQETEREISLSYLNIPLLVSLNTGKTKPVNLNFVAGPQIGINVRSSIHTSGDNNSTQALLAVKKSDFGIAYGIGLDFALNASHTVRLGFGYRGVTGLVDISDNTENDVTNSYFILRSTKIKTHSAYIGISILL